MRSSSVVVFALGALLICSCAHSSTAQGTSGSGPDPRFYRGDRNALFGCVVQATAASEWNVQYANEETGIVSASTPTNWATWGDSVSITVTTLESSVHRVDISSSSQQLFDWGRNSSNINTFFANLERFVADSDAVQTEQRYDSAEEPESPPDNGSEQISF